MGVMPKLRPVTTGAGGRETYQHQIFSSGNWYAGLRPAVGSALGRHALTPTGRKAIDVKVDRMAPHGISHIMQMLVVSSASPWR